MGVYINLEIMPNHIHSADWEKVYRETLELVHAYPFMDKYVEEDTYHHSWGYTTRTMERNMPFCDNQIGWHTIGDEVSMKEAESFTFVKDLDFYKQRCGSNGNCHDILFSMLEDDLETNEYLKHLKVEATSVFHAKTQGRPYHIPLLGIACLIECRFPKYALVSGDVSIGQMKEAVKWANTILKKPITLTERVNNGIVLQRIEHVIQNKEAVLDVLMRLTLNERDFMLGNLIRTHFKSDVIDTYYRQSFGRYQPGMYGFSTVLSTYLQQGFLFEEACELCVLDPNGCCYNAQEFVEEILAMSWPNKEGLNENARPFEINPTESTTPETVYSLLGKTMMKMVGFQETITPHLTYEEVVIILEQKMGGICDVRPLETEGNISKRELFDKMNEWIGDKFDEFDSVHEKYTVHDTEDLIGWKEGDTIHPNIEKFIIHAKKVIVNRDQDTKLVLERFDNSPINVKRDILVQHNRYFHIHKDIWEDVFEKIDDRPFIHHYLCLLLMDASVLNTNHLCKSLANNQVLFDTYIMNNHTKK